MVKAGDVVKVKVMSVDAERRRIGLSMRLGDEPGREPVRRPSSDGKPRGKGGRAKPRQPERPPTAMAEAFARLKDRS